MYSHDVTTSWDEKHSHDVARAMFVGLVYTLQHLDRVQTSDGWQDNLFERILSHLESGRPVPNIARAKDDDNQVVQVSSQFVSESHRVLTLAFAHALDFND